MESIKLIDNPPSFEEIEKEFENGITMEFFEALKNGEVVPSFVDYPTFIPHRPHETISKETWEAMKTAAQGFSSSCPICEMLKKKKNNR